MEKNVRIRAQLKARRKRRIRKRISGTAERPRLSVFRSTRHVYAQVIDDVAGRTLVSASSFEKEGTTRRANKDVCTELGKAIAERCKAQNISRIVFDKNGNKYHGRVEAVATGAREGGLAF